MKYCNVGVIVTERDGGEVIMCTVCTTKIVVRIERQEGWPYVIKFII